MSSGAEFKLAEQDAFHLGYEPSLDGLRGISILAVMGFNGHVSILRGGFIGVDVFFVLSGFLITALLVQEHRATSAIRLKEFYLRRAVRLLPALFVLIAFCAVYAVMFLSAEKALEELKGILYTLFYVANWAQIPPNQPGIGALSHAWSLSVEEQFYIFWPLMLLVLLKMKRRWVVFAALGLLIAISILLNVWFWHAQTPYLRMYFGTDTRANEILIGCVLALMCCWGSFRYSERLKRLLHPAAIISFSILFFAFFSFRHDEALVYNGGLTLVSIATGILIVDLVQFPSLISRFFEMAPLAWIGKISYGLYLWHYPTFEATRRLLEGRMSPANYSVAGVILTLLAATASYYLLERPLLNFVRRDVHRGGDTAIVSSTPTA